MLQKDERVIMAYALNKTYDLKALRRDNRNPTVKFKN